MMPARASASVVPTQAQALWLRVRYALDTASCLEILNHELVSTETDEFQEAKAAEAHAEQALTESSA